MSLILSLDTSLEQAAVALSDDECVLAIRTNNSQMDHAGWIHGAIQEVFTETRKTLNETAAVAVTSGPGSYTGLRVGMATAKGLCFALNLPLITENTLKLTASRIKRENDLSGYSFPVLVCPMIDARRMEVFTAVYDTTLKQVSEPAAVVLDETSFSSELQNNTIIFCGNGANKWKSICTHPNAVFMPLPHTIQDLVNVASGKFVTQQFAGLAYTEPDYFKNVYTGK